MENIFAESEGKMKKVIDAFKKDLSSIRTGRANTAVLQGINVQYYGSPMPINQVASISLVEAKTIDIKPWDRNMVQLIEKALQEANLGVSLVNTGDSVKVNFPQLTEETRKEMVKKVKKISEEFKVDIRNIRRETNEKLKDKEKKKEMSEDDLKNAEAREQKLTDKNIKEIDDIAKEKETDLLTI
ncbi:MAG: ribosome recycling factor [bacterium]